MEILSETWETVVNFFVEKPALAFGMTAAMIVGWTIETILYIKFSKK